MVDVYFGSGTRRTLHIEATPIVPTITLVLMWLDFRYLTELLGSPERIDQRTMRSGTFVNILTRVLSNAEEARTLDFGQYKPDGLVPLMRANASLINLTQTTDWRFALQIVELRQTESFDVSLDGLGDAVEKIVDSIDPLSRRRREEELRHIEQMNRYEELQAERENLSANIKAMIDGYKQLVDAGVMSKEEMVESIRLTLKAQDTGTSALFGFRAREIES